ncbi:MAG: hypothetical protein LBM74_05270 [Oscillospiraceae bacterium]|jgi:hypothetical protein|nr:hypothetical protein [Oscillospiraceae bacterium]
MTREELMHYAPLPEKIHQRMMQTAYHVEEEIVVKKKISLALVLALVLILAVCTAVAAVLLSSQQFVEQELVPRVEDGGSKKWTPEELSEIIRLADEYGVALSDEWREVLLGGQSEYPDTVIKILVRDEMGEPMDWTLEEAAWYSAMMVAIGQLDTQINVLPGEGEINRETALALVADYVKQMYDPNVDVLDATQYHCAVTYSEPVVEGVVQPRRWDIHFERLDPSLFNYTFTMTPQGEITEAVATPGARVQGRVPTSLELTDFYRDEYGFPWTYTQAIWAAMREDMVFTAQAHGERGLLLLGLLRQQYGTPDAASISEEAAVEAARKILIESGTATEQDLRESTPTSLYLLHGETPTWKILFVANKPPEGYSYYLRHAEVNAYTGEAKNPVLQDRVKMRWFDPYVLSDVWAEIDAEFPGIRDPETMPTIPDVLARYEAEFGSHYAYTQTDWMALQKDVKIAYTGHGHSGRDSIMILAQQCGTPDEAAISEAAAIEAANAPGDATALYLLHGETAVWKVSFPDAADGDRLYPAEVNAHTGEVSHREPFDEANTPWYELYMLRAVIEEADFMRSDNG